MSNPQGDNTASAVSTVMGLMSSAKEKWDASGASDAMGRVSASIPESTKTYVGSLFKRDHLRTITVFFGIGEERPFYVEKTPSLLMERLRHNFSFFYLNYIVMTVLLFCLTSLTLLLSPTSIIWIALLAGAWAWLIRASESGSLMVGGIAIPQKPATVAMGGVTVLVLFHLLSGVFWLALFSSGFLMSVHAFLRDASLHKDMGDVVDMQGDLHLSSHEQDSFLNAGAV